MTGYGKSTTSFQTKKITVEIKALNSKNIDINTRMPSIYREQEMLVRKQLASVLKRGKIDCSILIEDANDSTTTVINVPVVKQYMEQLKGITTADDVELLKIAIRFPEALSNVHQALDVEEWHQISDTIQEAITNLIAHRFDEGMLLKKEFKKRIDSIRTLLETIAELDPKRIATIRERLHKNLEELQDRFDENRFEQELIYYIEKLDITEEKVRLENHLDYFITCLNTGESNGKKLAFISQEMGREINTIGSKSNDAPMQQIVVQMKDELEKIKEQLLNVL